MACSLTPLLGSTVPKGCRNGERQYTLTRVIPSISQWNSPGSVIRLRYPYKLFGSMGNLLGSCTCISMPIQHVQVPSADLMQLYK
jgi:hypothetical protein